tara:strand:+ start:2071 stop:2268 length:198 start_codon:yes stop_codon:yes gene_type:complete
MNDLENLDENTNKKINELRILFNELSNYLNNELETVDESKELLEVLEVYKSKIQSLNDSFLNEEE